MKRAQSSHTQNGTRQKKPRHITIGDRVFVLEFEQLLRPLTVAERDALTKSIAEHGVIHAILVDEKNRVMDGAHRLMIAGEIGLSDVPVNSMGKLSRAKRRLIAIQTNIARRQLTRAQIKSVVDGLLRDRPQRSDRAIADEAGCDHKTVGRRRRRLEDAQEIEAAPTRTDRRGNKQPATKPPPPKVETVRPITVSPWHADVAPPLQTLIDIAMSLMATLERDDSELSEVLDMLNELESQIAVFTAVVNELWPPAPDEEEVGNDGEGDEASGEPDAPEEMPADNEEFDFESAAAFGEDET